MPPQGCRVAEHGAAIAVRSLMLVVCSMALLGPGALPAQDSSAPSIGMTLSSLLRTSSSCNWTSPSLKQVSFTTAYREDLPLSDQQNEGKWIPAPALSDEFNDTALDLTKWRPRIDGWAGRPPALFVPENVSVAGGMLNLKMAHQTIPAKYKPAGYHDFTTAAIQSRRTVLYGYFEIRAKIMPSAGSSGFWLASKTKRDWNEIDVFEIAGRAPGDPHQIYMNAHVFRANGKDVNQNIYGAMRISENMADDFHVYGVAWTASAIDTYLDGQHVRHICNTSWHMPLTILLDAETQTKWWGLPAVADLPSTFQVDYIRVWRQE